MLFKKNQGDLTIVDMKYLACFVILIQIVSISSANFGYSKRDQHLWEQKHKKCGGKYQSPVLISSSSAIPIPLPAIEMLGYHNMLPQLLLKNNGHTAALSIASPTNDEHTPFIHGSVFNKSTMYDVDHVHFHWGARNDRGSEHVLNYIRFPMEMHIVHRKRDYGSYAEALNHEDGVAVVAVFFQLQEEENEKLNPIVKHLPAVKWPGTEVKLNDSCTLASLIPGNIDLYYVYKGSLTTPPCSEVVTWLIFPTTVPISFKQISKFRTLSNGEAPLVDNYRQLQHLRKRRIYFRKLRTGEYNGTFFATAALKWHVL